MTARMTHAEFEGFRARYGLKYADIAELIERHTGAIVRQQHIRTSNHREGQFSGPMTAALRYCFKEIEKIREQKV